jgi:hypothetical protein
MADGTDVSDAIRRQDIADMHQTDNPPVSLASRGVEGNKTIVVFP